MGWDRETPDLSLFRTLYTWVETLYTRARAREGRD